MGQEVGVLTIQNVCFLINLPVFSKVSLPSIVSGIHVWNLSEQPLQRVGLHSLPGGWKGLPVKDTTSK